MPLLQITREYHLNKAVIIASAKTIHFTVPHCRAMPANRLQHVECGSLTDENHFTLNFS